MIFAKRQYHQFWLNITWHKGCTRNTLKKSCHKHQGTTGTALVYVIKKRGERLADLYRVEQFVWSVMLLSQAGEVWEAIDSSFLK